jgi:hypothetical protein
MRHGAVQCHIRRIRGVDVDMGEEALKKLTHEFQNHRIVIDDQQRVFAHSNQLPCLIVKGAKYTPRHRFMQILTMIGSSENDELQSSVMTCRTKSSGTVHNKRSDSHVSQMKYTIVHTH